MSTATNRVIDECTRLSGWVAPYVDGELDPGHALEMEAHVRGCSTCVERVAVLHAVRNSLKRVVARQAPSQLVARMHAVIAEERRAALEPRSKPALPLRYAVSLAAAAGVLFAMGMSRFVLPRLGGETARASDVMTSAMSLEQDGVNAANVTSIDALLDELVALHARPFPPDTTDPEQLGRFDPLLGVQVHRPAFKPLGVNFSGARVHQVSDRGALLQVQYTVADGKRFTMYVFNPRVLPLRTSSRLEPRLVRQRPMLVGRLRGYSIAALEQSGVGYAYASDLDTDESTRIIAAGLTQQ